MARVRARWADLGGIVCDEFQVPQSISKANFSEGGLRFNFENFIEAIIPIAVVAVSDDRNSPVLLHKANEDKKCPAARLESRPEYKDVFAGLFWAWPHTRSASDRGSGQNWT